MAASFAPIPLKSASTTAPVNATANGSSQLLAAANPNRVNITIQNNSDTIMYVNFGAAAASSTQGFALAAGATWQNPPGFCPTSAVRVIGTNTKTYVHLIY